jgi:hypothetical protein
MLGARCWALDEAAAFAGFIRDIIFIVIVIVERLTPVREPVRDAHVACIVLFDLV